MIDLAEASKNKLPNLRVLLAGEGPNESEVERQIKQRGLGNRIRMLGHREPLPVIQAADALLLPSVREGFSTPAPRQCAQACRCCGREPAGPGN